MQIPLYQKKVGQSTQSTAEYGDDRAMQGAIKQIGGAISATGGLLERIEQSNAESQTTQYFIDRQMRYNEFEKDVASQSDPEQVSKLYSSWIKGEDKAYNDAKLNNTAKKVVNSDNLNFYMKADKVVNGLGGYRTKAQIKQNDIPLIQQQELAAMGNSVEINGKMWSPEELMTDAVDKRIALGTMSQEAGTRMKSEFPSSLQYNTLNRELSTIENIYLSGDGSKDSADEYISNLNSIVEKSKDKKLMEKHSSPIFVTAMSRINAVKRKEMNALVSEWKSYKKDQDDGTLTPERQKRHESVVGKEEATRDRKLAQEAVENLALTDADARKAINAVASYTTGNESLTWAKRQLDSIKGNKTQYFLMLQGATEELIKGGNEIEAYEGMFKNDYKMKTTGRYGDFMSSFLPLITEGIGEGDMNKRLKQADKFIRDNKDLPEEEWQTAKQQLLKGDAKKIINKINSDYTQQMRLGYAGMYQLNTKQPDYYLDMNKKQPEEVAPMSDDDIFKSLGL